MNKKVLYWDDIEELVKGVLSKIQESGEEFTDILALARGGLVPATLIAHGLNLRQLHSVAVMSYHKGQQHEPEFKSDLPDLTGRKVLIVDDLSDTGKTIEFVKEHYPDAKVACLLTKPDGDGDVDFVAERCTQKTWVDFPWEHSSFDKVTTA